jgi:hypothetical protein
MGEIKATGKGGARAGAGRPSTKVERQAIAETPIDGRTVEGRNHAQYLIEQLNAIDPELLEHKDLLVSDEPIEIPANATDAVKQDLEIREARRLAHWKLKQAATRKFRRLSFELQGWAPLWFSPRTALECRKYLHDKSEGKAVQTLNHLHDKPTEHIVTLNLGEGMRLAMLKAEQRVSGQRN